MKRVPSIAVIGLSVLIPFYAVPFLWGQPGTQPATLRVRLVPDAQLQIDGRKTKQTGALRTFESTPLVMGWEYTYSLRATWKEAGQEHKAARQVPVRGGQTVDVDLRSADEVAQPAAGS